MANSYENNPPKQSRVSFAFWRQPVFQLSDGTYFCPGCDGPTYASNPWDFVSIKVGNVSTGAQSGSAAGTVTAQQVSGAFAGASYSASTTGSGIKTPGVAKVHVLKFRDVDKKKAAGSDGARITIHGVEPAEVEIELTIWTAEQFRQLALLWQVLFPPAYKGSPTAFDVSHPALSSDLHSISTLIFTRMEGPDLMPDGRGMFRLRAWEFLKPSTKGVTNTPTAPPPSLYDQTNSPKVPLPGSSPANLGP